MLKIVQTGLVVAGVAALAFAAAAIAVADDNSNGPTPASSSLQSEGVQTNASSTQSANTNPTNLPSSQINTTTEQQAKAPVVDPHAAAQDAAEGKTTATQAAGAQNANANGNAPDWPAPQRYDAGRAAGSNMRPGQGGASLGVNVGVSEDGQGIVVSRIWPGSPAQQMGLRPRDRITTVNGQPVRSVDEFIATIRAMNAGDQVQLSIDRGGNASNVGGRLEGFRESVATGQGPVGTVLRGARELIREHGERSGGSNVQTSFEDGGATVANNSADVDARIMRLEQQIGRLTQEIQQLKANQSTSPLQTGTPGGAGSSTSLLTTPGGSLPPASK